MANKNKSELPWLSVIMPCHNGDRWLAITLQSIVEQNDSGIEVILVDSSAADSCLQISARFSDKLNIRTYSRPDLLQWTAKTNFGVGHANSGWICILHQDDLWLSNRCESLRKWLKAPINIAMHLHPAYIVDERGKRLGLWRCPLPAGEVPREILIERLLVQNFIAMPAPAIRREAFLSVGGMDEALWYTADWDLYLKLSEVGGVCYHAMPLACFRIHKSSLTMSASRSPEEFRKQHEIVRDRYTDKLNISGSSTATLRLAAASIDVNTALAAANAGMPRALVKAICSLLRLGPRGLLKYLSYSRIAERVIPRLRARFTGGL